MAFNKIQPQQIQLPTFFSESGNLSFTDNSTGVTVELNETINGGPINFVQGIKSQGASPIFNSPNTTIYGSTNHSFASSGAAELSGAHNVVVGGSPNLVSGELNVIVNNLGIDMGDFSKSNTVIGGGNVTIDNSITGSVGLFASAFSPNMNQNQAIFIGAANGVQIASPTTFSSTSTHQGAATFSAAATFSNTTKFDNQSEFNHSVRIDSSAELISSGTANFLNNINFYSGANIASGAVLFGTAAPVEFNGNVQVDGAAVFNSTSTFNNSAEFNSAATCDSSLTLSDSSEAASRAWAGYRVTQPDVSTLIAKHKVKDSLDFAATAISNSQIVTGYLVTGEDSTEQRAHLVVETPFFTGGIKFDYHEVVKTT
tara:strand:+ start:4588 stop:5700 length:1113 start_codon:yes stop_codon:yes gene_type:complete